MTTTTQQALHHRTQGHAGRDRTGRPGRRAGGERRRWSALFADSPIMQADRPGEPAITPRRLRLRHLGPDRGREPRAGALADLVPPPRRRATGVTVVDALTRAAARRLRGLQPLAGRLGRRARLGDAGRVPRDGRRARRSVSASPSAPATRSAPGRRLGRGPGLVDPRPLRRLEHRGHLAQPDHRARLQRRTGQRHGRRRRPARGPRRGHRDRRARPASHRRPPARTRPPWSGPSSARRWARPPRVSPCSPERLRSGCWSWSRPPWCSTSVGARPRGRPWPEATAPTPRGVVRAQRVGAGENR